MLLKNMRPVLQIGCGKTRRALRIGRTPLNVAFGQHVF